jgi:hypothetical protein
VLAGYSTDPLTSYGVLKSRCRTRPSTSACELGCLVSGSRLPSLAEVALCGLVPLGRLVLADRPDTIRVLLPTQHEVLLMQLHGGQDYVRLRAQVVILRVRLAIATRQQVNIVQPGTPAGQEVPRAHGCPR